MAPQGKFTFRKAFYPIIACLIAFATLAACSFKPANPGTNARIGFMVQEYIGNNIAEIPYIEYDGEKNEQIDAINRSLNQGIRQRYEEFMGSLEEGDPRWIEIKSFPFTSEQRLQVVVTSAIFPNYGTDGSMFSINYDKVKDEWLTLDYALGVEGLDRESLFEQVRSLFEPEASTQSVGEINLAGFIEYEGDAGHYIQFLLEITVLNEAAEPWTHSYSIVPQFDSLFQMDASVMFEPGDMDQMDPPLHYQVGFGA